jgi:hypothetical protein
MAPPLYLRTRRSRLKTSLLLMALYLILPRPKWLISLTI